MKVRANKNYEAEDKQGTSKQTRGACSDGKQPSTLIRDKNVGDPME